MPPTSSASSRVSPCGIAVSSTSRSRNGDAIPTSADTAMSAPTIGEPGPIRAEETGDAHT